MWSSCNTVASFQAILGGRNVLAISASSICYICCQRVGRPNQISDRCHMTTVNRIASCVEMSQSCPFITIADRSIALVLHDDFCSFVFCLPSVAEPAQIVASTSRKGPFSAWEKYEVSRGLHCLNEVCNRRDVTSVYSLNSRKFPGRFSLPKRPGNEASNT